MSSQIHDQPGRTKSRKTKIMVAIALLVIAAGAAYGVSRYLTSKNEAPLTTAMVERGDIENTVTSLGKLKPKDYVDVGTQVSGQLKQVAVEIGDRVKKGDLIAVVDATVYETRVRTDRANLENLQAQLVRQQAEARLAQQQLTRNQALLKERAISQETVEQNQTALQVANAIVAATRAQIKASQATLEGDIANLGFTRIYAPMDGTVVSQTSLQGQTVNSSQQAPVIVRVADLQTMTVWAQVAEADVVKVKAGMPAYFSTLGDTERRWRGVVRQIMPTPETVNDVVLYNILVDVDNREQELMSDMTVQVFFVLGRARDVPLVPLAALRPVRGKRADAGGSADRAAGAVDTVVESTKGTQVANAETAAVRPGLADQVPGARAAAGPNADAAQRSGSRRNRGDSGGKPVAAREQMYQAQVKTVDGTEQRLVKIGVASRTSAEVVSGLVVGEQVVMPTLEQSTSGASRSGSTGGGGRRQMGPRL